MGGNMIQKVVVNVQRTEKKKKTRRRAIKRAPLRANNPLAYGSASSTNDFRIPTHTLQTHAPLLLPARTLDDYRAGGDNLLGYVPRAPMTQLANVKNDGILERIGQLEGNVVGGMRDAGKTFASFDTRLKTLQAHVGRSNLAQPRPIPRPPPEADPHTPKQSQRGHDPVDQGAPSKAAAPATKPAYPAYVPLTFMGRRPKPDSATDIVQRRKREVHRAEHDMKRAAYEREDAEPEPEEAA